MVTIATVPLLGGRPSLDLVNTVEARRDAWGPDLLTRYEDLVAWSERLALLTEAELGEARSVSNFDLDGAAVALARVKRFREALAEVIAAMVEGRPGPDAAVAVVADEVDRARRHQRLTASNERFGWAWEVEPPLDRIAHRIALDAAALLTDDRFRKRVKLCTGPNCGWPFLDRTKNGSRRWCRDEGCGAHVRVLRYRARKR